MASSSSRSGSGWRAKTVWLVVGVASIAAITAHAFQVPPSDQSSQSSDRRQRLTIGVLRRDGLLSPFASFDGHDWDAPWPTPLNAGALPIGIGDVPKKWWGAAGPDADWKAWLAGGTTRPLKLLAPLTIRIFCSSQIVLRTDYHGGPFERGEPTVPKDGVAIAGDASIQPIDVVPADSADARAMAGTIAEAFNREEEAAANRFSRWKHPVPERERREVPIQIEAMYRSSESTRRGSWTTTYVEAVRKFEPGPKDQGCGLITFGRAWVYEKPGSKPRVDLGARVTYCDRADASYMLPFGQMVLDDEVYWIYQTSSWRDELYTVARVTPKEVRPIVVVSGGFCQQ
jgi:hypothetical protein